MLLKTSIYNGSDAVHSNELRTPDACSLLPVFRIIPKDG